MFPNSDRRILKSLAVRPCESVSPATLLTSLINLSHNIVNYKSVTFSSQKRISREVIRQVEILLIFFKEFRGLGLDSGLSFTHTLMVSFSELHLCLQKIRFLLQDCTAKGSRVYILMKSNFVANQFRVLVRSLGIGLDIVQFGFLGIDLEVRELIGLVNRQAFKAKLEPDPSDVFEMNRVNVILSQFEGRVEPKRVEMKRVLDYVGIKTWEICNEEIKFLKQEISNGEEKEVHLLSNLLGFLCFCRGVIFDTLEKPENQIIKPESEAMLKCLNPDDFRCPISLELMMDPVTISTGHTFDRSSIQKWLKAGHLLCPKTGENLTSTELVPNLSLKKLIHKFCVSNRISIPKPTEKTRDSCSRTLAYSSSTRFLAQFLAGRLTYGSDEQKNKAAYEIRLFAKSDNFNRLVLIEMGNVVPLLNLTTDPNPETQENAIAALLKLSKHPKGLKSIMKEGGLILVISVLRNGINMESRQIAAAIVFYLSSVDRYRKFIGSKTEAFPALMELIKTGSHSAKKNSLAAIFGLLMYHGNHERLLEAGIVPLLIYLISSGNEKSDILSDELAILASLAEKIEGSIAILQTEALPLIIAVMKSSISRHGKEYCVSILLSACKSGGDEVIAILAKETSIMTSFYSLIVEGNSNACKKAITLINMLQKYNSSSLTVPYPLQKERIARAFL